jgi:hypothetical protein
MNAPPYIVRGAVIRSRPNRAIAALFIGACACSDTSYRLGRASDGEQFPRGSSGAGGGSASGAGGTAAGAGGGFGSSGRGGSMSGTGGLDGGQPDPGCPADACQFEITQGTLRERRADVVLAIDTASTPNLALEMVELALNPFADALANNGIELRLAVLAQQSALCVRAPLGSGACEPQGADSRLPNVFHHPTAVVDEADALEVILAEYPVYSEAFEPFADTTLIVVTGGDARAPFNTPTSFEQAYTTSRLPNLLPWRMSAFYGFSACAGIRAEGRVYREIVERTGGVHADLCTESGSMAFGRIAESIVDNVLPCTFLLPEPRPDQPIDLRAINVLFRVGVTNQVIPFVASADRCDSVLGGWYYDDPLSTSAVVMCAASCERMRTTPRSELTVAHGCPTLTLACI